MGEDGGRGREPAARPGDEAGPRDVPVARLHRLPHGPGDRRERQGGAGAHAHRESDDTDRRRARTRGERGEPHALDQEPAGGEAGHDHAEPRAVAAADPRHRAVAPHAEVARFP